MENKSHSLKRRNFLKRTLQGTGLAILGSNKSMDSISGIMRTKSLSYPNILHIMPDQHTWGTIAGRSECRTPNINKLAEEGILFNRSYTPCSVCCPARAMLITGSYQWHNGVFNQVHSAPSVSRDMYHDVVTYSQRIKEAGYQLGYVGKWHASHKRTPLDFGFDEIGAPVSYNKKLLVGLDIKDERKKLPSGKKTKKLVRQFPWPGGESIAMWGYDESEEEETDTWGIAETGIKMLQRFSKGEKPWHIEIHLHAPHNPYMPLKKYRNRYDASAIKVPESFYDTFENKPGMHRLESETWGKVTEKDYQEGRAFYYAYCEQLDVQIGRILDALNETGQSQNTIVVFTSDHGDMVGSHRMWIKGWIPYEEAYRIPMVIRWPKRIKPGSVSNHLVQLHDLAYTYIDALGLKELPFNDGRSLIPLFEDPKRSDWRDDILCAFYGAEFLYTQRIVITQRYKYVFNGFDYDELYDLFDDPQEIHNRIKDPDYKKIVDDMRARLYELMNQFEDPYRAGKYGAKRYLPIGKKL